MPPPVKTTQPVKNPKKGRQPDFDHHLKAQLAHSISASVTSSFMAMLGVGFKGDLTLKNTCWLWQRKPDY